MKYLSVDIETTGLNPEKCQTLEVSFVVEDTNNIKPLEELPRFTVCIEHKRIHGEPYALSMPYNASIINDMKNKLEDRKFNFIKPDEFYSSLLLFLSKNDLLDDKNKATLNIAGKNFQAFDKPFIMKLLESDPQWNNQIRFRYRVIDPAILFVNWKDDSALPDLNTCKQRANISGEVAHDSYSDALDVIKLLRSTY